LPIDITEAVAAAQGFRPVAMEYGLLTGTAAAEGAARQEISMSRRIALLVTLALAIGSGHAWAQKVKTDFDPAVNFGTVKTYYWAKTDPVQNDLMNQRLISAVDHWLTAKGWTKADAGQADVAVMPLLSTQQGQTLNTFYDASAEDGATAAGVRQPRRRR
jgi:hypothetical protein